jgi:hypothetical protein
MSSGEPPAEEALGWGLTRGLASNNPDPIAPDASVGVLLATCGWGTVGWSRAVADDPVTAGDPLRKGAIFVCSVLSHKALIRFDSAY